MVGLGTEGIEVLINIRCDVDERALSQAAAWGHKECVRYLVAARCPGWDAYDEAWSPGSPQW